MPTLNDVMTRFLTLTADGILDKHDMERRIDLRRREDEVAEVAAILRLQKRLTSLVPYATLGELLDVQPGIALAGAVIAGLHVSNRGGVGVSTVKLKRGLI